jgi:hypothetical protein
MLSQDQFYKTLRETIVDTFASDELELVIREQFNKNLYAIVSRGNQNSIVYDMLQVARRAGWLDSLLKALAAARPQRQRPTLEATWSTTQI